MSLEEAIKTINSYDFNEIAEFENGEMQKAIDTVLRTLEMKNEYLKLIDFLLVDYDGCKSVETLKELIDETREYIHKALKNDGKSVVYRRADDKGLNILHKEVE